MDLNSYYKADSAYVFCSCIKDSVKIKECIGNCIHYSDSQEGQCKCNKEKRENEKN